MRANSIRLIIVLTVAAVATSADAQRPLVPGTGQRVEDVGDSFEEPDWAYHFALPKSSKNLNDFGGGTAGESANDHWYEGQKRGQPDIIKIVPTPKGGLAGSTRSLLLRSLHTGVRGRPSHRMQQDDFIANVNYRLGGAIPTSRSPNVTTRVFLPKIAEWERRSGPHFAFRVAVTTTVRKPGTFLFPGRTEDETYWPGFFIEFNTKEDSGLEYDTAHLRIRADSDGDDFKGPQITKTGWWTFGMSCTPDGMLHYYARPGVEELTDEDYITSTYPYGARAENFRTFFFNVCNGDDGKTWSTQWIIDDPMVYYR